jgi:predicted site-specific integrase-resolvase
VNGWLTPAEVAKLLNMSAVALRKWRHLGIGPNYLKMGDSTNSRVRYNKQAVEAWIEKRMKRVEEHGPNQKDEAAS